MWLSTHEDGEPDLLKHLIQEDMFGFQVLASHLYSLLDQVIELLCDKAIRSNRPDVFCFKWFHLEQKCE